MPDKDGLVSRFHMKRVTVCVVVHCSPHDLASDFASVRHENLLYAL